MIDRVFLKFYSKNRENMYIKAVKYSSNIEYTYW